jgi:hypothetical protein
MKRKAGKYFVFLKNGLNSGVVLFVAWLLGGILLYISGEVSIVVSSSKLCRDRGREQ